MTHLRKLQFQCQALQNFWRRIKRMEPFLDPPRVTGAIRTADRLEAKVRARWTVRFAAFRRQVDGRG